VLGCSSPKNGAIVTDATGEPDFLARGNVTEQ
jgi:hypothetical protein